MKHYLLPVLALLTSCSLVQPIQVVAADWMQSAEEYVGLHERRNRGELKEILGFDPVRTEWCAAFVNAILEIEDMPSLNDIDHPYPLLARSFLDHGSPVNPEDIKLGDVVIFPRGNQGWQGHVGFYSGTTPTGEWIILGGNQDETVSYRNFKPHKAIGIRRIPHKYTMRGIKDGRRNPNKN